MENKKLRGKPAMWGHFSIQMSPHFRKGNKEAEKLGRVFDSPVE